MQSKFLIALPILAALSGCSEEIQARDQPPTLPAEIKADEAAEEPSAEDETETPGIELRNPVGLD